MTKRQRLANRRAAETFGFECNGLHYTASISRFPDGSLAEIFIGNSKAGSHSDAAAKDSAVVCSIALQYGVPVETIRHALLRDSDGRPPSPLGAALDLIAGGERCGAWSICQTIEACGQSRPREDFLLGQRPAANRLTDLLGPVLCGIAQGYLEVAERVINGQLDPAEAREAMRALAAAARVSVEPPPATMHFDHEALSGFVRDACAVSHADAAAMLATLVKRTGASDRELLLAALDVLRELTAAQRETGAA